MRRWRREIHELGAYGSERGPGGIADWSGVLWDAVRPGVARTLGGGLF